MTTWTELRVAANHLAMLQDSGISPEVAATRGYFTATSPSEVPEVFNKVQRKLVPSLVIPVYGVDDTDEPVTYELRPDTPRTDNRGGKPKVRKYEYPSGARKVLDVPRSVRPALADPKVPLWITEGARKADAAATRSMACVSVAGVWGFRTTNGHGGKVELPDLDKIALNGRDVRVAFDSDVMDKDAVRQAVCRLAGVLTRRGANVDVVVLPSQANGAKTGLDDFLAAGGDEAALLLHVDPMFFAEDSRPVEERIRDYILDSYTLGQDVEGNPFVLPGEGPRLVRMLYTGHPSLELEVAGAYPKSVPGKSKPVLARKAIKDALMQIESDCAKAEAVPLNLRTAVLDGHVVLDLGRADGRVAAAQANGVWGVGEPDERFPLFRRTVDIRPLPVPVEGGSLKELRDLLNVNDETWPLILGWLIAAPFGAVPRPWLFHTGPQGSGKSDAALIVASCWDPRGALSPAPAGVNEAALEAVNSFILGYDNLSSISLTFSDWLCSAVTGAVDRRKVLYTTSTMQTLKFMRTGVLTGITLNWVRSDLMERLVHVEFDPIERGSRRRRMEVMNSFTEAHPRILGALLEAVSLALAHLDEVDTGHLGGLRMGDYAAILAAYDIAANTDLLGAYRANVTDHLREQAEEDPFCQVVLSYMVGRESVDLTASELYGALSIHRQVMTLDDAVFWPNSVRSFGWAMRRASADLREAGILARHYRLSGAKRWLLLRETALQGKTAPETAPA